MTTITLHPDIDERLTAEARRQGVTPERLALDTLQVIRPERREEVTIDRGREANRT